MKKFIQNAFSRLLLLSTFTLIGLTSFGQFNYVPGTVYTFRTLISSTQTIQIDVLYDGNDNATVTLTNVSPQTGDKAYSHIFLPTNNEYTFDQNTGELEVKQNQSYYKKIVLTNGSSTDLSTGPKYVPNCPGCDTGGGGCTLEKISNGNGCWQICCSDDLPEPVCTKCKDIKWTEAISGIDSSDPILIIRLSGNLTIQ
ncbi:MAG: hypothetical protein FGM41_05975 [Bacteroidetes bacterium]|nr:hypothetical protein [Bacteroidota bacterium]